MGKYRNSNILFLATAVLAVLSYVQQVVSIPVEGSGPWPTFHKRNVASLARGGYIKTASGFKRSISTLAKNGQLPTFRAPYDETDKQEDDNDGSEKRNIASIARLRSYGTKRNIQALARDGYKGGRGGPYSQQTFDKRNIQALARNGYIHKKDDQMGDEYFYPFYQNAIPPLSEVDGPIDYNELYDLQQSINPDLLMPLSQVYKRSYTDDYADTYPYSQSEYDDLYPDWYNKRGSFGSPVHGVYRSSYAEPASRVKRYILSLPDILDRNDVPLPENVDVENQDKRSVDDNEMRDNFEKRHIGSLARLGLLPSFRFSGGRYSRSGRARLLLPSQELYRKHSANENFGIRKYIAGAEAESAVDPDDTDIPPSSLPVNSHPTGRLLQRPLNNDLPPPPHLVAPLPPMPKYSDTFLKNRWQSESKEVPKFYYFRSLKIPYKYHESGKRYVFLPPVNNVMLRKSYPNSSLPSRRKNQ